MFLFESFTYDSGWASQYYEDFYNASSYFQNYLNQNSPFPYIKFMVKRVYDRDHSNKNYQITYVDATDLSKIPIHKKYFSYMYHKMENYGVSVSLVHTNIIGDTINFKYNVDYDETRWNEERQKYKNAYKSDEILNCTPTFEQWMYMVCAKFERKNPNSFLSKEKSVESVAAKYIIAVKLNWDDAIDAAFEKMSELLALPQNVEKYSSMFKKFIKGYAHEYYEIDSEIEELINDFKSATKDVSTISTPARMNGILQALENNPLVKKYQCIRQSEIQIMTINGNLGSITIGEDTRLGNGFYKIVLHLQGDHHTQDKKSHSYKYKALSHIIDSAVNAIYKRDPNELDKITIKI